MVMSLPSPSDRRVVVTGMGLVSCLGSTLDEVSRSLRAGRSGIGISEERIRLGFRSPLTGVLPPLDPAEHFTKKQLKSMPEHVVYMALAAARAFAASGTPPEAFADDRTGLVIGNDSSARPACEILDAVRADGTTQRLGSGAVVRSMNSSPSINLVPMYRIRGPALTVSAACASGAHAVGWAYLLIKLGWIDRAIAGACQELGWESMAAFDGLMTFSARGDDPAGASRPFSKDRDGLVPSGGAAALLLESLDSARARGASVAGEILAYACNADGDHITNPNAAGPERCMRLALDQAGLAPRDIDYVNAHATSTPAGDLAEARAIHAVFGPDGPPVSSTKSMTGHECWMGGASEAVYSLLMIRDGFIAPNINFAGFDAETPPIRVVAEARPARLDRVLSNSFGFGGTNACLVLGRYTA
jgi:3-oxoacyl-[acyl-carrier-protein] synthase-1